MRPNPHRLIGKYIAVRRLLRPLQPRTSCSLLFAASSPPVPAPSWRPSRLPRPRTPTPRRRPRLGLDSRRPRRSAEAWTSSSSARTRLRRLLMHLNRLASLLVRCSRFQLAQVPQQRKEVPKRINLTAEADGGTRPHAGVRSRAGDHPNLQASHAGRHSGTGVHPLSPRAPLLPDLGRAPQGLALDGAGHGR